jgi:hypothetical protein
MHSVRLLFLLLGEKVRMRIPRKIRALNPGT